MSIRRDAAPNAGRVMAEDVNVVSKGQVPENHIFSLAAESARQTGEIEMQFGNDVVRAEYQKRLHEVGVLRTRAQLTAQNLRTERGFIIHLRSDLTAILQDFEGTMKVNLTWLKVHESTPSTSLTVTNTNRSVTEALDGSVRDIRSALLSLVQSVESVNQLLAEIDEALASLDQDILIKSGTMMLDRACMENLVTLPTPSVAQGGSGQLTPRTPRGSRNPSLTPRLPSPRDGKSPISTRSGWMPQTLSDGASTRSYPQRQHDWHSRAQHVIVHGTHVAQKCLPLRRSVSSLIRSIRESGRLQRNPAVLDALQQQAKHGEHLGRQIDLNAKALQGHLLHIRRQRAAMEASLEKLDEQLDAIRQRIRLASVRPVVDQTPSNVEETLHVEATKLERTKRELVAKLRELVSSEKTTSKLLEDLDMQTRSNQRTLAVTKQCIDVKLPAIVPRGVS